MVFNGQLAARQPCFRRRGDLRIRYSGRPEQLLIGIFYQAGKGTVPHNADQIDIGPSDPLVGNKRCRHIAEIYRPVIVFPLALFPF